MSRFSPVERDTFRGLRTIEAPTDVPAGYSPECYDVTFINGRVEKRPGTRVIEGFSTGAIRSIKEYVKLDTTQRRLLLLDAEGRLMVEDGTGLFSAIVLDDLIEDSLAGDMVFNSVTMFGREYMAFSAGGRAALLRPRQYDDTNLDPVAPEGPGKPPIVSDGAADPDFGLSAGIHKFRIFFRTRTGFWTTLSPPVEYNAPGGLLVNFEQLPIGPAWVTGRTIVATPEGSDDYYFIAGSLMEISDNTSDVLNGVGWGSDAVLISGTAVSSSVDPSEDQLRLTVLPAQAGVVAYKGRLGWFGERATIARANDEGFLNLTFNGGVASIFPNVPLGWTQAVAGGTVTDVPGGIGKSFKITGTGIGGAAIDNNVKPLGLIPHGVEIRARIRAKRSSDATQGTIHLLIAVPTTISAGVGPTMEVDVSQLSDTEWRLIDGQLLPENSNFPAPDWILRLAEGGGGVANGSAINAGAWIAIDDIEIYPAKDPTLKSQIRWSKVDDPESYDDLYGRQFVNENDGQDLRAAFVMRESCYAVKERSLYRIVDNPDTEPTGWSATQVSPTVGTLSPRGIGHGDGWAVIASRDGLQWFNGSAFINLSEEIQPTWDRINHAMGHKISVEVNTNTREIFVAVPLDGATENNTMLHLDYEGPHPASVESRDWSIWRLPVSSMTFSQRPDGARELYLGTNDSADVVSYLLKVDATTRNDYVGSDDEAPIDASYLTDYVGGVVGRRLFGYMTAQIEGNGTLYTSADNLDYVKPIATKYLDSPIRHDKEWPINIVGSRVAFKFRIAGLDETFSLTKLALFSKMHPWMKIRGRG